MINSGTRYIPGLEVIKHEYILRKHPIIALYFESENKLKFYNLEARSIFASLPLRWDIKLLLVCQKKGNKQG